MRLSPDTYRLLAKHAEVAKHVLHPFGEKAAFLGSSGDENGKWLERFRGTDLHAEAINLAQQELQLSMQREQQSVQEREAREQMDQQFDAPQRMLRQQRDQIGLRKEQLNLRLEELVNQGNVAPSSPALSPGLTEEERGQAVAEGQELATEMGSAEKAAAPLGWMGRLRAAGGAALEHGLKPGTGASTWNSMKEMAVPGALLGAAGGFLSPDENKGESRFHSALMGGLSGGALGGAMAGLGGLGSLKNKFDSYRAKGMKAPQAASATANSFLTPEGRAAHRVNRRAERMAQREGTPPVPPTAAAHPEIPDLQGPNPRQSPNQHPSRLADTSPRSADIPPVPNLPTPTPAAGTPAMGPMPAPLPSPTAPAPAATPAPATLPPEPPMVSTAPPPAQRTPGRAKTVLDNGPPPVPPRVPTGTVMPGSSPAPQASPLSQSVAPASTPAVPATTPQGTPLVPPAAAPQGRGNTVPLPAATPAAPAPTPQGTPPVPSRSGNTAYGTGGAPPAPAVPARSGNTLGAEIPASPIVTPAAPAVQAPSNSPWASGWDHAGMGALAERHGVSPDQMKQLLDPNTPISGPPVLPSGTTAGRSLPGRGLIRGITPVDNSPAGQPGYVPSGDATGVGAPPVPAVAPAAGVPPVPRPASPVRGFANSAINNEIMQQAQAAGWSPSAIGQVMT